MSHPYWPQPMYLYQRSQPHGPYPDAMGDYGSRYTHGIFRQRYALPPYVEMERTGLEGLEPPGHPFEHGTTYYGFDGIEVSCAVGDYIQKISGIAGVPFNKIPIVGGTIANAVSSVVRSQLNVLAKATIEQMMKATSHSAFSSAFSPVTNAVRIKAKQVPGAELLGSAIDSAVNSLVNLAWSNTQNFMAQCMAQVSAETKFDPTAYPPGSQPDGAACSTNIQCYSGLCVGGKCVAPPTMTPQTQVTLVTKPAWDPVKYARLVTDLGPTTQTPKPIGVGTAAVVGAAALAALLLLRR